MIIVTSLIWLYLDYIVYYDLTTISDNDKQAFNFYYNIVSLYNYNSDGYVFSVRLYKLYIVVTVGKMLTHGI
jgi:hypothetical protein